MKILFRCDASPMQGMGHIRRCRALAIALKERHCKAVFACRNSGFNWFEEVKDFAVAAESLEWKLKPYEDAMEVVRLCRKYDISMVIVDHYRGNACYQKALLENGLRWAQFDGAVNSPLWANWVINTSPQACESEYKSRCRRNDIHFLLGPQYAILRPEFAKCRRRLFFRKTVGKILLTFGGGDDRGATIFCLNALSSNIIGCEVVVCASSYNPRVAGIRSWVKRHVSVPVTILEDCGNLAKVMADSDIAVTAGGTTVFETSAMGVPGLVIQIAKNQAVISKSWEDAGVVFNLGSLKGLTQARFGSSIKKIICDVKRRKQMRLAGMNLVDGLGAGRLADVLLGDLDKACYKRS